MGQRLADVGAGEVRRALPGLPCPESDALVSPFLNLTNYPEPATRLPAPQQPALSVTLKYSKSYFAAQKQFDRIPNVLNLRYLFGLLLFTSIGTATCYERYNDFSFEIVREYVYYV